MSDMNTSRKLIFTIYIVIWFFSLLFRCFFSPVCFFMFQQYGRRIQVELDHLNVLTMNYFASSINCRKTWNRYSDISRELNPLPRHYFIKHLFYSSFSMLSVGLSTDRITQMQQYACPIVMIH